MGRSGDPEASYWIDCLRPATEGIYIIHRYVFSTNSLSSSSAVLLVLIRGGQPHVCALFACISSGKTGSASLLAGPRDTEPLLGYCIWQLLTPAISIGPAQNRSNCIEGSRQLVWRTFLKGNQELSHTGFFSIIFSMCMRNQGTCNFLPSSAKSPG